MEATWIWHITAACAARESHMIAASPPDESVPAEGPGPLRCPLCLEPLVVGSDDLGCQKCSSRWPLVDGIPSFVPPSVQDRGFYEQWHSAQAAARRDDALRRLARRVLKPMRYFAGKRERLFRAAFRGATRGWVLDLACGIGQPLYLKWGPVVGVDLSIGGLRVCKDRGIYERVIHADATRMEFLPDESFSYAVSADFFGHVPASAKDQVISELHRVLIPGGVMAHVIETDSRNMMFRFAHKHPDLFRKYFIEQIGGHYGLELPTAVVRRFEADGFKILSIQKMWGPVWETREYIRQFDNEYAQHSTAIRAWVTLCKSAASNPVTLLFADLLLGVLSIAVDFLTPLDHAQGVFLVAQKIS